MPTALTPLRGALTPTQRDIYLDQQRHPGLPIYSIGCSVDLGRELDPTLWERAVREVFAREPVMQTRVHESGGDLWQQVEPGLEMRLRREEETPSDLDARHEWITARLRTPVAAGEAPFQHWLVRTTDGEYHSALGAPHLLSDGHSYRLFFERASLCYEALAAGRSLPELTSPSFYEYQQDISHDESDEASRLVSERLRAVAPLRFRTRREVPGAYASERILLDDVEREAIAAYCRARGLRPATFLLALYAIVLQRFREPGGDWVVHAIRGARPARFAQSMGCFFHVVPYVLREEQLQRAARLDDLFAHLRHYRSTTGGRAPLSMLRQEELLPAGGGRAVYNYYDFDRVRVLGRERSLEVHFSHPPSEVQLVVGSRAGQVELRHFFHTRQLHGETVLARVRRILGQVVRGAERIADLDWLLDDERPAARSPRSAVAAAGGARLVHERFAAQAAQRPEAVALVEDDRRWSYGELASFANRLARVLVREGVGTGTRVGLYLDRSGEQVGAILAVLAAGGGYVPIDREYPQERARFILDDSGVELLLTDGDGEGLAGAAGVRSLSLDAIGDRLASEPTTPLAPRAAPADLAYVIYTSGSTGQPKGVMVTHENVARLFGETEALLAFGPGDVWPLLHSYAFDFSVWEMWGALAHGGRLVVVPACVARSPEALRDLLAREGVTVLNQTPSAFYRLVDAELERGDERLAALRWVIFGGEALDVPRLRPWLERYGDERPALVNMYGITETTVHVTWRRLRHCDATPGRPSVIGTPLPDRRVYLTDEEGELVPRGVAGELWVGGGGVARGYLGREALTAARFVADGFSGELGARLYRSGDLARELEDGELEYLGRVDTQVQVRGYRVELGEIEAILRSHASVSDAAVVARAGADGDLSLVAYVVRVAGSAIAEPELRELLRTRLPPYMACARYCFLPVLPLTAHGKVDRDALPEPGAERPELAVRYQPPRTQTEEIIAHVFGELTGVEQVGIEDDFFALGGNSLSAAQALARVRLQLGVDLPLAVVFDRPTVSGLATAIAERRFADETHAPPRVVRVEGEADAPLTFAQERVWLIQQLHPRAVAYHFEAAFTLRGSLQVEVLARCLQEIVDRHEVLRTTFPAVDGRPVQRIHQAAPAALEMHSLEDLPLEEARAQVEERRRRTAAEPMAVDRLPLARWTLFRLRADEHVLIHREHHLLHDGWSFAVLAGELLRLYRAYAAGDASPLQPLPLRLRDLAHAEREWLHTPAAERQLAYWREQLAGAPAALELPGDFARPAQPSYRGDSLRVELPDELADALREVARVHGVTVFAAALSAFAVLLARTLGERDLRIGSGVANRRPETEGIVGMVLNNVVLRLDLSEEPSFGELLARTQRVVLAALSHQDLPFDRVVRLVADGAGGGGAVCPVFFSSYDGPLPRVPIDGLTVDVEAGLANGSAKFDLNVILVVQPRDGFAPASATAAPGQRVGLIWEYSTDLFARATMERMARDYVSLLRAATADPGRAWSELAVTSESEALALARAPAELERGEGRAAVEGPEPFPSDATVVDLFVARAASSPLAVAVHDQAGACTYRELDAASNRIAQVLRERKVAAEDVVGVCMTRGQSSIAAMLGVLKAGAAYLPLDPRQPDRRLSWLLADAGARCVLTETHLRSRLPAAGITALCLDEMGKELLKRADRGPEVAITASGLAYVMYTSGSTGPPKGVEVVHRGIVRLLAAIAGALQLGGDTRLLQAAPLSFDASTFEIWTTLLQGGTLTIYPEEIPDLDSLGRAIADHRTNVMWLNASLFNSIVDEQPEVLAPLAHLLIGGEALSVAHVRKAQERLPRTQIWNGYGPTENTTFSTLHPIAAPLPPATLSVPLGRPLARSSAYVLDERRRALPWGAIGEIWLGGDGLARGYRARPELDAEAFAPDPFAAEPGARLYRSGDLGRWRPDGTLEFRGRRDLQVKIRGFRVEPAEIEWALQRLGGIARCAVVAERVGTGPRLVAYLVLEPGVSRDVAALYARMRLELPAHLVPEQVVFLDELPLTSHGKVDRGALPAAPGRAFAAHRALCSTTEEIVAGVMAELLGIEDVGAQDHFFDLGGHSLLGLELMARLSRVTGVALPVRALLEHSTVAGLAALVDSAQRDGADRHLVRIKPGGSRPPLFFTPGGDGGPGALLVYARVARFLDAEQPFYGLKALGSDDGVTGHRSVEEMAADYLGEVRRVQPHGPYFFAGECVGGVIAYEMARQALGAGEEMGLVALLDSRPPRLAAHLRHGMRVFSAAARRRLDRWLVPLADADVAVSGTARLRRWLDGRLPYSAREAPAHMDRRWIEYQRTLLRYRPAPYEGRMALLLSQQYSGKGVARHWQRLVRGGLQVWRTPGDHDSYIRAHARATATILSTSLQEARAAG